MGQCILIGKEHIWYLDSGCSRHMTICKSLLEDFIKKDGPTITYRDNDKVDKKVYGTIKCNFFIFKNVSYVKDLQHNLMSISQLCDPDYENDIYILDMFLADNSIRHCFFFRAHSHLNWLWHKRLSHLHFKKISKI
uniref:Retrovirus-related Pol polyprotein from transposon TNT 1-94-like beta-barrel domain-containing protein n=1 Tax=Lactuca sativa TaxID=4236 RepID=A0A9R1X0T5_LACSA|nr:hypothetical protein LSAT_V11C800446370 [Lactuca sativa]